VLSYTADGGTEIAVQVTFDVVGRNARVETSTYYQIAGQPPQLFRVGEVAGLYNMALVAQQKYDALAKKLKDEKKKAAEKQRDAAKAAAEQLLGLNGVYQALNKTAKIQFRVYSLVGDQQLVLFEPKPPEAQPAQAIEGASAEQLNLGGDRKEEGDSGEPRRFFSK
jgi:hypothetical protein